MSIAAFLSHHLKVGKRRFRRQALHGYAQSAGAGRDVRRRLDGFAYHVPVPWVGYVPTPADVGVLPAATVALQTRRAVRRNPTQVLGDG
ncbi:MAG: hypothetical protein WBA12_05685 [Catalinimonas sp.]